MKTPVKRLKDLKKTCSLNDNMSDPLDIYESTSTCPNCYAVTLSGISRCPECGTFHSSVHLVERVPTAEELRPHEDRVVDPSMYSLNPNSSIKEGENSEDVEDTTVKWQGGSADFSFIDEVTDESE